MTIGSPIDKHLVLWPLLWKDVHKKILSRPGENGGIVFDRGAQPPVTLPQKIKWRNYYNYGDPIGFQLDTAVEFLCEEQCAVFEFDTKKHDFGFSRYALPGKAHNDYWTDARVFGHFIDDVVFCNGQAQRPGNLLWQCRVSMLLPFVLTFLLHFAAVFVLYKGITAFTASATLEHLPRQISLFPVLLTSITVAARLPRLVKTNGWRWHGIALLFFAIGALCIWALPAGSQHYLGGPFVALFDSLPVETYRERAALIVVSAFIASSGWWVKRVPARGRRWLVATGAAVIGYVVVLRLWQADSDSPVWPLLLAGLAFLYSILGIPCVRIIESGCLSPDPPFTCARSWPALPIRDAGRQAAAEQLRITLKDSCRTSPRTPRLGARSGHPPESGFRPAATTSACSRAAARRARDTADPRGAVNPVAFATCP